MLDLAVINDRVRTLIRELLSMPANSVRPAEQNEAPAGDISQQLATVKLTLIEATGQDDFVRTNQSAPSTNITESVEGQRLVTASINFYRGDAYTKAARLPAVLSSSTATERMKALGLGLVGTSQARNLTAIVDTNWEERGQIDVTFHITVAETTSVPTYGEFEFDVSTADASGNTTTQTFGVFEP